MPSSRGPSDGRQSSLFPLAPELNAASPVYEEVDGWEADIRAVRKYSDLPGAARAYVERIEHLIGMTIKFISVGPERDALITR